MSELVDHDFKCTCGERGELSLDPGDRRPFACPAGCGAVWVQWFYRGKWRLRCVVQPVYDEAEEASEPQDECAATLMRGPSKEWMKAAGDREDEIAAEAVRKLQNGGIPPAPRRER